MATFNLQKVLALPVTLAANTMYLVGTAESEDLTIVVTDKTGNGVKKTINAAGVEEKINNAIESFAAGLSSLEIVADIAARDALADELTASGFVLVQDASADETVESGAALYVFNKAVADENEGKAVEDQVTPWVKVAEYESLDLQLTWENIEGRPTSDVADIDASVTLSKKFGEDEDGNLTYNGVAVAGGIILGAEEW